MFGILVLGGFWIFYSFKTVDFTSEQIEGIRSLWGSEMVVLALEGGETELDSVFQDKYLSPDYLRLISPNATTARRLRRRLIDAQRALDDETRSRMLAASFLKHPGETLLAAVALIRAARTYSQAMAVKDFIKSEEISAFAEVYELTIAGCFRAIDSEESFNRLMQSQFVLAALSMCVSCRCYEIVSVPQIQTYLTARFLGYSSSIEMQQPRDPARRLKQKLEKAVLTLLKCLLIPAIAVWPPLGLRIKVEPRLRYHLYEGMLVCYFFLLSFSELSIYRYDDLPIRDWGFVVWTCMLLFSQLHFISLCGLKSYLTDYGSLFDTISYVAALVGLTLNLCHGNNLVGELLPGQCGGWPPTTPTAGLEVTSVAVLLIGLRLTRVLTLHPLFGPLMLSLQSMIMDVLSWLVIVAFFIVSFAAAQKVLFSDRYVDPLHQPANCRFVPETDFKDFGNLILILAEMMLNADGEFQCLRGSTQPVMSAAYSYLFILITAIVLVNILVALVTKVYDLVQENVTKQFLFIRTRTINQWLVYPIVPPPFSFASIPFYVFVWTLQLINKFEKRLGPLGSWGTAKLNSITVLPQFPYETELPKAWYDSLGPDPLASLSSRILAFKQANASEGLRMEEFQENVTEGLAELRKKVEHLDEKEEKISQAIEELTMLCRQ
ncbi:MAG: hypothetical protein SGPRY_007832, partial [Prymnesium sp.]